MRKAKEKLYGDLEKKYVYIYLELRNGQTVKLKNRSPTFKLLFCVRAQVAGKMALRDCGTFFRKNDKRFNFNL